MTVSFKTRNPNEAFPITLAMLKESGVALPSRYGACFEYPEAVSVTFTHPLERVLSHPQRRINPFLHYFEPFWILAGRRDVAFMANIAKRFKEFSDDGVVYNAAYGYRLRQPHDQIAEAIARLKKDPTDRRSVLQIRTQDEIFYNGKDTACNISVALKIRDGALNMHVFNRSNDAIWGGPAGGTNHPQFTTLLEYIAGHVDCGIGTYTVTTDSMHAYENEQWAELKQANSPSPDPYMIGNGYRPYPMMGEPDKFETDLRWFFEMWDYNPESPVLMKANSLYFREVFLPMWKTFCSYKAKDGEELFNTSCIVASDWRGAVRDFLYGIPRIRSRVNEELV